MVALLALPDGERRNEFGFSVNGHKDPLVAKLCRVVFADSPLFLVAERPDFIALNEVTAEATHTLVHQPGAPFPGKDKQLRDGVTVASQSCALWSGSSSLQ